MSISLSEVMDLALDREDSQFQKKRVLGSQQTWMLHQNLVAPSPVPELFCLVVFRGSFHLAH